ncbi:MAG TPA: stalk domain-containing protein [Anaerolineae bacterium]|jgi:hypothetical protein|nr:stalk domain-containing protein [Anaerolineae bacterium]
MGLRARLILLFTITLSILLIITTTASAVTLTLDEQYMLNLVNKERRSHGLQALEIDPKLTYMARRYCQEMIDYNFFGHVSPVSGELLDRVVASGVPDGWLLAGENLAGAPTVEAAFQGLMNSPSHKDNMLEPKYTHVGIGVVKGGTYGKMFAQEFIAYPKNMFFMSNDPSYDLLIYVNDQLLYSDPPAFIYQGHTLVPVRPLFEQIGATVTWDSISKRVVVDHPNANIIITAGDNLALINYKPVILDTPPILVRGTTFIPLRFVAEGLGAGIEWNNTLRTVDVTLPDGLGN